MKTYLISLFLFSILLLQGCIQAPSNSRKSSLASSSTATGTNTGPGVYPTFSTDEMLYWFTTAKITNTVTINKDSQDIIYLRGKNVHDFLNAKDITGVEYYRKQYCMVGNFATGTPTKKQLRVRAVPIYVKTSTNAIERLLRLDIPSDADNMAACNFSTIDTIIPSAAAFSIATICPTCTGLATTTNLSLYEAKTSSLVSISSSLLNFSSIFLKTDFTSNSTSPNNSCTNTSCSAQGFDCCISGQCVKDASEKTNASIDPQYAQAKSDYATNPLSFINYPNIYYICTNIAHTPPTSSGTTTTPMSAAQLRVFQYASDWKCINDYTANGANVYYVHKINNTFVSSLTGLVASSYNTVNCDAAFYAATKKKLAVSCGCTSSDSEMAVKCPDWGVVPVYNAGAAQTMANITDFNCYTPVPENPIGPITNLNVSVPNRSSPHRFYTTAGVNFDSLTGLQASSPATTQENTQSPGNDFHYIDEYNKAGPVNGSFNINSVIGKMTVDLSHALPAKMVNVELGKAYILSATSGYFTPCSRCAKDSWFQTFTANPITQRGVGLQASGYTTSRDTYAGNTTFGNYEDTKFGRACYVPVTMLPLSHQKNTGLQVQRQNRLTTQAAQYINGYQRDWYGFNKGALIGSFDGVTWFAIGTGRRATATSTKLFLALNASFSDLADMTDTIVNIIPDFSANTAADYDYDPDLSLTDSHQNAAATCQKFHQCSVDADCVSQLGWEYTCADVSQYKTKWPVFDSEAKELANQEKYGSLFEILQNTISTSNNKRCIYRGAGAPCKKTYSTGTNEYTQKSLTCAPNFYCASLFDNKFNDELVRSPNELDNILFGMDANILGRPLNYVTANKSLSAEIISNIKYNSALNTNDPDDMGICRPGKSLSSNPVTAHITADTAKRTDYISQIGSCDSTAINTNRFVSCPAFDDSLNYVNSIEQKQTQNSCGAEAKHTTTFLSAFKSIEGLSLLSTTNISQPTLVQDACYRRAGSVCHTDLDCGPNKMHEDVVGTIDIKYFGGTEAEQSYWRESLVCSQGTPAPTLGTAGYLDYKLNENRCCREIGKDFTMVTQGPASIVPENVGTNINVITDKFAFLDPKAANRYSRYSISKELITDNTIVPKVSTTAEPVAEQWKVINETGALTCCGGGYIRKFADGTHDWKVKNRFNLDAANFSCLNFRSPLADPNYATTTNFTNDQVVAASYTRESEYFCKDPKGKGCLQIDFQPNKGFAIDSPKAYVPNLAIDSDTNNGVAGNRPTAGNTRIDTSPTSDPSISWTQKLNNDVPYTPIPYRFSDITIDGDSLNNWAAYNFFTNKDFDYGVQMYLPAYIGWDQYYGSNGFFAADKTFIKAVYIKYFYDSPLAPSVVDITKKIASPAECLAVINAPTAAPGTYPIDQIALVNNWCIVSDPLTQNRPVINIKADKTDTWKYAGIIIDFLPIEGNRLITKPLEKVAVPGNPLYYLSKLARLELLGIPQITYEPLYCNSNQEKLVPGIFKSTITTRANFNSNSISYSGIVDPVARYNADSSLDSPDPAGYGNYEKRFTYQNKIDHPAVFSSKDFACCVPLGKTTTSAAKCCTSFAVGSICKLPKGTDLNVYFNKLVSNEGVGETQPGGGLTITGTDEEIDFNPYTGEPKYRGSTYDKLVALGNNYCDGGTVVTGGAFGEFPPEPFSGSYTVQAGATGNIADSFPASIVDSVIDFKQSDPNLGKVPFDSGFKWNHHYYCK